jgi:4,4'-diaponeurosporenoate glycosyltransferase
VVVPARNEAGRIPALLAALRRADPPPAEVVVVDDGSDDGTAGLAAAAGARVLPVTPPPGWRGKTWACWQGAGSTTGEILVFLDADTEPDPGFVADLAAAAVSSGGLVSVQPYLRVTRLAERMTAVAAVVVLMGTGTGTVVEGGRRRRWRRPAAFGPAMAMRRSDYLAAGGHAAVSDETVEDLGLAWAAAGAGFPVSALVGAGRLTARPYPEGGRPLVDGWTRVLAAGAGGVAPLRLVLVVAWVAGALVATAQLVRGRPVGYVLYAAQLAVLLRRLGSFGPLPAIAYPAPLLAFLALFLRSATLSALGGEVRWRDREVPLSGRRLRRSRRLRVAGRP